MNQHKLPSVDVSVSARDGARTATTAELYASLEKHWQAIAKRWQ